MFTFTVDICERCRKLNKDWAHLHGKVLTGEEANKIVLPRDCECGAVLAGNCDICLVEADALGYAASLNIAFSLKDAEGNVVRSVNACGKCVVALDQMLRGAAPVVQTIKAKLTPKIVPARPNEISRIIKPN